MNSLSNLPSLAMPMVDSSGRLSPVWLQFFLTLFARTGGAPGILVSDLQAGAESGMPTIDLAPVYSIIHAVEAMVAQAMAAIPQRSDERGETGDGASVAHLSAKVAELEARIEAMSSPMLTDTTQLTNGAKFLAAASNLSDVATPATARSNLGLGSMATQAASAIAVTGGTIDGTPIGSTVASSGQFTSVNASGTLTGKNLAISPTTTPGPPGAGTGGALPATPMGYMVVSIGGTNRLIPYY